MEMISHVARFGDILNISTLYNCKTLCSELPGDDNLLNGINQKAKSPASVLLPFKVLRFCLSIENHKALYLYNYLLNLS